MELNLFKRIVISTFISFSVFYAANCQQESKKVLFVGNSYTESNNLPHIVAILSKATNTHLQTKKSVVGGGHLWEHWNSSRGLKTKELIKEGNFDMVVLQDFSMSAINTPDSTYKYTKLFSDYIQDYGAKIYLYNTWARKKVPQFQQQIDAMYEKAAKDINAICVPVGSAWKLAQELRPGVELFTSDGSHPNSLGTFLTACVFVGAITGEIPDDIPNYFVIKDSEGESVALMYMDRLDIEFCRRVAREVLQLKKIIE